MPHVVSQTISLVVPVIQDLLVIPSESAVQQLQYHQEQRSWILAIHLHVDLTLFVRLETGLLPASASQNILEIPM